MEAYVLIKTSGNSARNILAILRNMDGVAEANGVYGIHDIVAKVTVEDPAGLVLDNIRSIAGVTDTITLVIAL